MKAAVNIILLLMISAVLNFYETLSKFCSNYTILLNIFSLRSSKRDEMGSVPPYRFSRKLVGSRWRPRATLTTYVISVPFVRDVLSPVGALRAAMTPRQWFRIFELC